jgi:hypothetical protein
MVSSKSAVVLAHLKVDGRLPNASLFIVKDDVLA